MVKQQQQQQQQQLPSAGRHTGCKPQPHISSARAAAQELCRLGSLRPPCTTQVREKASNKLGSGLHTGLKTPQAPPHARILRLPPTACSTMQRHYRRVAHSTQPSWRHRSHPRPVRTCTPPPLLTKGQHQSGGRLKARDRTKSHHAHLDSVALCSARTGTHKW